MQNFHISQSDFPMMGPYIRRDEKAEITLTEVGILADLGIPNQYVLGEVDCNATQ